MPTMRVPLLVAVTIAAGAAWSWGSGSNRASVTPDTAVVAGSGAAAQAPWSEADLWLAPPDPITPAPLAQGVALVAEGLAAEALPLLTRSLADPVLGPYAHLYVGRAELAQLHYARAATAAERALEATGVPGLEEPARWLLAEALEGAERWTDAVAVWQALAVLPPASPSLVQVRLARSAERAGQPALAREAYLRVHYDWPASAEGEEAEAALRRLGVRPGSAEFAREFARAGLLFASRRFTEARADYQALLARAPSETRPFIELRLAQCDVGARRHAAALKALDAFLATPHEVSLQTEAGFARLTALRELRRGDYPAQVARFVSRHGDDPLAETALNDLATAHILDDRDEAAADVFADMYARYPTGAHADRAAWRAGWWAYRQGRVRETIRLFESASTTLRRADYRPSWLYWTARSYERLEQHDTARHWYLRTIADYRNSYYGRMAAQALESLPGGRWTDADVAVLRDPTRAVTAGAAPAGTALAERLLAAGLWDDAVAELRRVQAVSGPSPVLEATIAFALNRKGELRPGITAMRRAYPQFMSDGGQHLPERLLKVIFPVAYPDLIRRYADERGLDPYLLTALMAQESTFQADVRSSANAWGLMQLLPSTGRRYATRLGISGFSTASLTNPDINVRLGTAYLADLMARFGDVASALASYNAGENRVARWRAERPGVARDEFIDDIPFPETQNYVKRIIGTTEDYRQLYASIGAPAPGARAR